MLVIYAISVLITKFWPDVFGLSDVKELLSTITTLERVAALAGEIAPKTSPADAPTASAAFAQRFHFFIVPPRG